MRRMDRWHFWKDPFRQWWWIRMLDRGGFAGSPQGFQTRVACEDDARRHGWIGPPLVTTPIDLRPLPPQRL
jgi:hypothetical protein